MSVASALEFHCDLPFKFICNVSAYVYIMYICVTGGKSGLVAGSQFNLLVIGNSSVTLVLVRVCLWPGDYRTQVTGKNNPENIIKEPRVFSCEGIRRACGCHRTGWVWEYRKASFPSLPYGSPRDGEALPPQGPGQSSLGPGAVTGGACSLGASAAGAAGAPGTTHFCSSLSPCLASPSLASPSLLLRSFLLRPASCSCRASYSPRERKWECLAG